MVQEVAGSNPVFHPKVSPQEIEGFFVRYIAKNLPKYINYWQLFANQISKDYDDNFVYDSITVAPHNSLYKDYNIVEVFYVDDDNNQIKVDVAIMAVVN